jgi:hypothetical protein
VVVVVEVEIEREECHDPEAPAAMPIPYLVVAAHATWMRIDEQHTEAEATLHGVGMFGCHMQGNSVGIDMTLEAVLALEEGSDVAFAVNLSLVLGVMLSMDDGDSNRVLMGGRFRSVSPYLTSAGSYAGFGVKSTVALGEA